MGQTKVTGKGDPHTISELSTTDHLCLTDTTLTKSWDKLTLWTSWYDAIRRTQVIHAVLFPKMVNLNLIMRKQSDKSKLWDVSGLYFKKINPMKGRAESRGTVLE